MPCPAWTASSPSSRCPPACPWGHWRSARRARSMPGSWRPRSSPRAIRHSGSGSPPGGRRRPTRWPTAPNDEFRMTIPPGSTIGILGGGQLGRMLAMAAAQLGYRAHIYAPDEGGPAADVTAHWTQGSYEDVAAMRAFAGQVDALTFEFENIPTDPLASLSGLRPPLQALEIA